MKFRTKTILGVASIEIILVSSLIFYGLSWLKTSNEVELQSRAHNIVDLLATTAKDAVLAYDVATLEAFTSALVKEKGVVYVRIFNNDTLLAKGGDKDILLKPFKHDYDISNIADQVYDESVNITEGGNVFGRIELGLSTEHIESKLNEAREKAPFMAVLGISLSALFSWLLGNYLTGQLAKLREAALAISDGDIGHQINVSGKDELADTEKSMNRMSSRLKEMYDELAGSLRKSRDMADTLHESELYTNTIINNIADVVVSTDRNGTIDSVNDEFEKVFGYKDYEVIGRNIKMLMPLEIGDCHDSYMDHYFESGNSSDVLDHKREYYAHRKDGRVFPVAISVKAVRLNEDMLFVG